MKYKIKIFYQTGDSVSNEDRETFMDGIWENEQIVEENIQRIEEHNNWYRYNNLYHYKNDKKIEEPEWHKGKPENSVVFKTDDGTEYLQAAFWCGYFETLYGAEAIEQKKRIGFRY